ncbi:MAG: M23 family metallopeptidase [bacterium]
METAFLILAIWLLAWAAPAGAADGEPPAQAVLTWSPEGPLQGQVVHFMVTAPDGWSVTGMRFRSKPVPVFRLEGETGKWHALCGLDAQLEPGRYEWSAELKSSEGSGAVRTAGLEVLPAHFAEQHLKLPSSMVDLSAKDLERVRRERSRVDSLWRLESPEVFWKGPFIEPVKGERGTGFGLRRWINGEPRSMHSGLDVSAAEGTPVEAANAGRVALVGDHFFEGKCVFLDHGGGLYTMYFHLSRVGVQEGSTVSQGDVLGWVGHTGRGTGAHLHWGVRLGGARVDPQDLLERTGELMSSMAKAAGGGRER